MSVSSIDPRGRGAVLRDRRRVVGSGRQVRAAAPVQSRAAELHPRPGPGAVRGATPRRAGRSRACASWTSAAGGGLLSEPMCRLGFQVTGVDASERNIGTGRRPRRRAGACHRLPGLHRRGAAGGGSGAVRRGAEHGGHRACGRPGALSARLRAAAGARRADGGGHTEPHPEARPWPRWGPNMCCAGCRPAPTTGASS